MNQTFLYLCTRTLFLFMVLSVLLMACARPASTVQIVNTPTQTSKPTSIEMQTETPRPPIISQPSSLVFSSISGDAGNFALLAGETITFTWENAPTGADKFEFVLVPLNKEPSFVLGVDFDDSDGVAASWSIPEHMAAELHATAYFPDDQKIELSFAPMIYSGDFPPARVCSLIARIIDLDNDFADFASEAAANNRLRGSDAVYAAVTLRFGTELITLDKEQLERLPKGAGKSAEMIMQRADLRCRPYEIIAAEYSPPTPIRGRFCALR